MEIHAQRSFGNHKKPVQRPNTSIEDYLTNIPSSNAGITWATQYAIGFGYDEAVTTPATRLVAGGQIPNYTLADFGSVHNSNEVGALSVRAVRVSSSFPGKPVFSISLEQQYKVASTGASASYRTLANCIQD